MSEQIYENVTYGRGYALKVTPEDRSADVMHYLITGGLLGGRSLDGVTWTEVKAETAALDRAMRVKQ